MAVQGPGKKRGRKPGTVISAIRAKRQVVAPKPAAMKPSIEAVVAKPVAKPPVIAAAPQPVVKAVREAAKPKPVTAASVVLTKTRPVAKAVPAEPAPVIAPEPVMPAPIVVAPPVAVVETIANLVAESTETASHLASAAAEPIQKGLHTMATTFDTAAATDKAKAMFGDINDRAKSAMEKSAKMGEEMTEFTKGNVEAIVASGRVAAKGAETMAQDVAETVKKHFESATAQMKSIAAIKSPTELFQLQSDYAKTYFDSAVADASKFSESMMKLMGDIAQPLSSRYAVAAEKIKSTVA